jgi:hypothetical protein
MILHYGDHYYVGRDGEELVIPHESFEEALAHAQRLAGPASEIGVAYSELKYVRGTRGAWKRVRVEWIERPPCAVDCPNAGMDGACLRCGGGYRKVDPSRFLAKPGAP